MSNLDLLWLSLLFLALLTLDEENGLFPFLQQPSGT